MPLSEPAPAEPYREWAAAAAHALQRWYRRRTGLWQGAGWWNAANALTAVIQYSQRTGDHKYRQVIGRTFDRAPRRYPGFTNDFYDDNGWWALAWIAAFDLTGEERYLNQARDIFTEMTTGWDDVHGGGLWWSRKRDYKNAIPNELFLLTAARLHQRAPGDYLDWARREWTWLHNSGLIGPAGLVNDGLTAAGTSNGGPTWTYNQGVIIGGLAALHEITGDHAYLEPATAIASAALRDLTVPPGILTEPGEAQTAPGDPDRPQFKGIFVRNLYELHLRQPQPAYRDFILANAASLWRNATNRRHQVGLAWAGPFDRADPARQSSALDTLNAAVGVAGEPAGRSEAHRA
jgi:predicted alpha-1,6-mannanase (GH76 family)